MAWLAPFLSDSSQGDNQFFEDYWTEVLGSLLAVGQSNPQSLAMWVSPDCEVASSQRGDGG